MDDPQALVRRLIAIGPERRRMLVADMAGRDAGRFDDDWPSWLHDGQAPPSGDDWQVWVMLAGRGFGKTRAGAEWVSALARAEPGACFALVAATGEEARKVMIEGRSGLLAVARARERRAMRWEPSLQRLRFASGATAFLYSGAHADGLRGFEHHYAWCDELAKWPQAEDAWANLMLSLRLGARPRALVTTTPRPIAALRAIIGDAGSVRTGGAMAANPHLPDVFVAAMERQHGGTRLGRQELAGELVETVEGALWSPALIEASRAAVPPAGRGFFRRVVVGVDPPASTAGGCGIVVCGLGRDGVGYVLADVSLRGASPESWARQVAAAAADWGAHRVVAEANNGGRMVETVLRGAAVTLPVRLVHASEGKAARAEPVSALFESGQARFAGRFPALEQELAGLSLAGGYEGPGRSPDRADAMVWALTELMLGRRPAPAVRPL